MNFSKFFLVLLSIGFVTTSMDKPAQPKPARPLPPIPTTKPFARLLPPTPAQIQLGKELNDFMNKMRGNPLYPRKTFEITSEEVKKIRELIAQNADVNSYFPGYHNAPSNSLVKAVEIGNMEIFKLIFNNLTNLYIARDALIHALVYNQLEMAELIVSKFGINQLDLPDPDNNYLIHSYLNLITYRDIDTPELRKMAEQQRKEHTKEAEEIQKLRDNRKYIEYNKRISEWKKRGTEIYEQSVRRKRQELDRRSIEGITFLIKHNLGSLINETRGPGQLTPLMVAAHNGLLSVVQLLTSHNPTNLEMQQFVKGQTTSYLNVLPSDVLTMTLEYDRPLADIHKKDAQGRTALDIARYKYKDKQYSDQKPGLVESLENTIKYLENLEAQAKAKIEAQEKAKGT